MKTIVRLRWILLIAWIGLAAGLFAAAPNLQDIVHEKGLISLPDGAPAKLARELLDGMGEQGSQAVFVFHDPDGLDEEELAEVREAVDRFASNREDLGLISVVSHFDQPELEERMESEDGTTVLVLLSLEAEGLSTAEHRDKLYEAIADIGVPHYLTGGMMIDEDVMISSQEGVKKTELITFVFILIILFAVYRSVIAPFVPLIAIGLSYLVAQSVVALLGDHAGFPLSTFTQIFMVAVMFGIGTDYSILLISRFKEELAKQPSRVEAVAATYRTAGKTVLFSGLAVLIGFVAIGFSQFILYRSAVAVAVGVAVTLVALFTLMPFFRAVLGPILYWPGSRSLGHSDSRLWGWAGRLSLSRPLVALLIVAAVTAPLLFAYDRSVSYNSLDEIGDKYDSVRAFNIIADKFGPGETLPTTVVLRHDDPLDNPQGMAWIERISREMLEIEDVQSVRSATRPTGDPIENLEISGQAGMLQEGLDQGADGIDRVRDGLAEAAEGLKASEPQLVQAEQAAAALASGTAEAAEGLRQLAGALGELESGVRQGALGAGGLRTGLEEIRRNAETLRQSYVQLADGYGRLEEGVRLLAGQYGQITEGLNGLADGFAGLEQALAGVQAAHAGLAQDAQFQTALGMLAQLKASAQELAAGTAQLNVQLAAVQAGLAEAGSGFAQANAGQAELYGAFDALIAGLEELERGLAQAADGQRQIADRVPGAAEGLEQIRDGQLRLQDGFREMNSRLGQLADGLDQSVEGLEQIGGGLRQAADYLRVLAANDESAIGGWYMPEEALETEEFRQVLDAYLSEDRRTVKLDVIFSDHPYDRATLAKIDEVYAAVDRAVQGTELENAARAAAGVTSVYHDLSRISDEDFQRTALIMLSGIFVVLAVLLRSLVMPVYLMASLLLTYYTSVAFAEWLFVDLIGYSGLTWAVSFFAFVMLLALGIDYSIFLMGRFNEYRHLDPKEAILEAMRKMGTVIFSAVIILGGTFAAMLPSGVLSVMQIATVVLAGLVLYALIYLPLFIPMMVRMFGPANWWPFGFRRDQGREADGGA